MSYGLVALGLALLLFSGALHFSYRPPQLESYSISPAVFARLGLFVLATGFAAAATPTVAQALWAAVALGTGGEWLAARRSPRARTYGYTVASADGAAQGKESRARLLEVLRPVWVIACLPLLILGSGRYVPLGVILLAILWVATGRASGVWGGGRGATFLLATMLVPLPAALFLAASNSIAMEALGYLCASVLAFYTLAVWARTEARVLAGARFLVLVYGAVGGLSPLLLTGGSDDAFGRLLPAALTASLPQVFTKNVLGGMLAVALPLALAVFIVDAVALKRRAMSIPSGLCLLAILGAIAFSGSRGAALAATAGTLVMALILIPRLRPALAAVPLGLTAAAFILPSMPLAVLWAEADTGSNLAVRSEIWSHADQVLVDFPLTGSGLGSFKNVVPALYPYLQADPTQVNHAHNLYLQIASDLGLLGLASFVALVGLLYFLAHQRLALRRPALSPVLAYVAAGGVGGVTAMLAHGLVDSVTWGTRAAFVSWAILGLLAGLLRTAEIREN